MLGTKLVQNGPKNTVHWVTKEIDVVDLLVSDPTWPPLAKLHHLQLTTLDCT